MSNTLLKREENRNMTFRMGDNETKIDFVLTKNEQKCFMQDVKAIPGEFQHVFVEGNPWGVSTCVCGRQSLGSFNMCLWKAIPGEFQHVFVEGNPWGVSTCVCGKQSLGSFNMCLWKAIPGEFQHVFVEADIDKKKVDNIVGKSCAER